MAYIGNTVQNQGFAPAIDYFSGNGVTVTFTLSRPVASVAQLIVAIDNVIQNPSTAFTVAGNSITFTSAPLSGTNNIWVEYTSLITTYQGISQDPTVIGDIRATGGYLSEGDFGASFVDGTVVDYVTGRGRVTVGALDDITFYHGGTTARSEMMDLYYAGGAKIYGTTALTIPVGTTAQRPGTPAAGMIRMNTTTGNPEWYNTATSSWIAFSNSATYIAEYLVVAGGGGGGGGEDSDYYGGGGGGAGGYLSSSLAITQGTAYTITVGAGGAGGASAGSGGATSSPGVQGSNSSAFSQTATGGGYGAQAGPNVSYPGGSGGSGGGASSGSVTQSAASGTAGQGNAGGVGLSGAYPYGAAGGGAGAVGGNAQPVNQPGTGGGTGGVGLNWQSLGTFYAGGGGGGGAGNTSGNGANGGPGGSGGGGAGGSPGSVNGTAGTSNTGGGGGGGSGGPQGSSGTPGNGAAGGSGVVIIRYLGVQRATGGTVTSSGGYTYHTFTTSGTFTA